LHSRLHQVGLAGDVVRARVHSHGRFLAHLRSLFVDIVITVPGFFTNFLVFSPGEQDALFTYRNVSIQTMLSCWHQVQVLEVADMLHAGDVVLVSSSGVAHDFVIRLVTDLFNITVHVKILNASAEDLVSKDQQAALLLIVEAQIGSCREIHTEGIAL